MLLIWGQKWGRYRRYYYGLPLRINLKPPLILAGVFKFIQKYKVRHKLLYAAGI